MSHNHAPEAVLGQLQTHIDELLIKAEQGDVAALYSHVEAADGTRVSEAQPWLPAQELVMVERTIDPYDEHPPQYRIYDVERDNFSGGKSSVLEWDAATKHPLVRTLHGLELAMEPASTGELALEPAYLDEVFGVKPETMAPRPFFDTRQPGSGEYSTQQDPRVREMRQAAQFVHHRYATNIINEWLDENPSCWTELVPLVAGSMNEATGEVMPLNGWLMAEAVLAQKNQMKRMAETAAPPEVDRLHQQRREAAMRRRQRTITTAARVAFNGFSNELWKAN